MSKTSLKDSVVGIWKLLSCSSRTTDGETIPGVWGEHPKGQLIYLADGHMAVQLMNTTRSGFAQDDARSGTIEEIRSAFEGYCAYYGTYQINDDGTVFHTVEGDLIKNFEGEAMTRHVALEGNRLTLTTPPYAFDGKVSVSDLTWVKVGPTSCDVLEDV